jgi:hypothetical protein
VAIAEGAHFRGSIDMQRTGGKGESKAAGASQASTPAAQTTPQPTPAGAGSR